MKKNPMPLIIAFPLLLLGIFLGSIFTFGMQYWNAEVDREDCRKVETEILAYGVI